MSYFMCADDTAIVTEAEEQLQNLMEVMVEESTKFGLESRKEKLQWDHLKEAYKAKMQNKN